MGNTQQRPKGKYAWSVKVGERGQFVIPKEARKIFGIHPGDTLLVLGDEDQGLAIPKKSLFAGLYEKIFGTGSSIGKGE